MWSAVNTGSTATWSAIPTDTFYTYFLLQENGDFLLQENGSRIVTAYVQPTWPAINTPPSATWTPV